MMIKSKGNYRGKPVAATMGSTKTGKSQVKILLHASQMLTQNGWEDISATNQEITYFGVLEKNDGTINEYTVNEVRESIGWDGYSPEFFSDSSSLPECQFWVDPDDKGRLCVKRLYHYNREPGAQVSFNEQESKAAASRINHKLRQFATANKVKFTPPVVDHTTKSSAPSPSAASAPPPSAPSAPASGCTREDAWAAVLEGSGNDQTKAVVIWNTAITAQGKPESSFTDADWGAVRDSVSVKDDLPF